MSNSHLIKNAPLSNKIYYLENVTTVWRWVLTHHSDLLTTEEVHTLEQSFQLSLSARALLSRLMMRQGDLFERSKLSYEEITNMALAIDELIETNYLQPNPKVDISEVCTKASKTELFQVIERNNALPNIKRSATKASIVEQLGSHFPNNLKQTFSDWGLSSDWLRVTHDSLFTRIRLMFFGNLHQDWSEFVITELGHIRYENVQLSPTLRAFQSREDIDHYIALDNLSQMLEAAEPNSVEWTELVNSFPKQGFANRWLERKRQRLGYAIAFQLEREGELERAIEHYQMSDNDQAKVRQLRLMERTSDPQTILATAYLLLNQVHQQETQTLIQRVIQRQNKKLGVVTARVKQAALETMSLTLEKTSDRVELAVLKQLHSDETPVYYVENQLIPALWALLYWDAIYAPIPGAFFHPFQPGPSDLFAEDFFTHRQDLIVAIHNSLENDKYKTIIRQHFHEKQGISCPFIHWPTLSEPLIEHALSCISKPSLVTMFDYLCRDLRNHKKGLPDLIRFHPKEHSFELIEVKSPNDQLQTQQKLWLAHFQQHNIKAKVCKVSWRSDSDMR